MKVLGTKVDNSEYDTFNSICNDCGISKSEQLRELVKDFNKSLEPDLDPSPKETKPRPNDPSSWRNLKEPQVVFLDDIPEPKPTVRYMTDVKVVEI